MQLTEINSEMDIYCYSENLCEAKNERNLLCFSQTFMSHTQAYSFR